MTNSATIPVENLKAAIHELLSRYTLPEQHKLYVVDTLVSTSLWGIDTHGVELLPTYLMELAGGRSLANPNFVWDSKFAGLALLDAGDALGVVAGNIGIRKAIDLATEYGVAAVGVKNSNHFGAAGYYAKVAADSGMLCFAFSNSDALVAASEGRKALNGTNPIALVANGTGSELFYFDMATSQVAYSKVRKHLAGGSVLPHGWAIDEAGVDTEISGRFSALKPLGGYKGQGLAMVVQILCALLMKAPFDAELTNLFTAPYSSGRKIGHFFLCVNIEGFIDIEEFQARLTVFMNMFRESSSDGGSAIAPGDKEWASWTARSLNGVPVGGELLEILASTVAFERLKK